MSHPLSVPLPSDPSDPPLPEASVRLVRLSRLMTHVVVGAVLVALIVLVLVFAAASRYVEAAGAACGVGWMLLSRPAVRRRKA